MTDEEKIQELLNEPCWNSEPYLVGMDKVDVEDVMERFAEWKDEQCAQEKQQWIDKAMKVICNGCAQKAECEFNNWKTCSTKDELMKSIEE